MQLRVLIIAFLIVFLCNAQDDFDFDKPRLPCDLDIKCSFELDTTWATDGRKCYVFRNPCHLAKANCKRQNLYEDALRVISKKRCQSFCKAKCPRIRQPVCGYYNNEFREFSSKCSMEYYMCKTGKTYLYYYEGPCDDPLYHAN